VLTLGEYGLATGASRAIAASAAMISIPVLALGCRQSVRTTSQAPPRRLAG